MRRAPVLTVGTTLAAGLALLAGVASPPSAAAPAAPAGDGYGRVWNILPPGQSGSINAVELAVVLATDPVNRIAIDGVNAPPNFADQLETYDALTTVDPSSIETSDIGDFYKDAGFTPQQVVREETPTDGVRLRWDQYGVPYVNGDTYADTLWGAGYAATLDRMFLMDVLRHAGAARLAEFAGGTEANLEMDRSQLRGAFYTHREASRQIVAAARRYGTEGARLLRGADAYLDGINAAQEALCPGGLPTGQECPAEYVALQQTPQPWTRADLAYVASLVGGIFGKGGGGEYANARWLQQLQHRLGDRRGLQVYEDLRERNDPEAPTTSDIHTPYGTGVVDPERPGVAMPDLDGPIAPGTGSELGTGGGTPSLPELPAEPPAVVDGPFGPIQLNLAGQGMSNALLVGADHTTTGHPVTVFGPQTSYYTPQLLTEQVLVGPHVRARGVAFAGVNLVVQLGRGPDYAWSATSASNDNVDTVVERLCDRDGTAPTVRSTGYRVGDRCVPMDRHVHTESVIPNITAPTPPETHRYLVLRTRHGIVQLRTTVNDRPVAIVLQRSTYGREVDSVAGFARLNDPGYVDDAASFEDAVEAIDYTFNWFYADDRDIAYYSSGRLPQRAAGTSFDLPRWGDKRYDWQGFLPSSAHPQQVNPPDGYLVSWNNKTAPGFAAADDVWGYGAVYRSLALEDRIRRATRDGGTVDEGELVGLVAGASTVDSRARYTLPLLLDALGRPGTETGLARAVHLLRAWVADGAHRVDRDRDGSYAHEQAIAIFDSWWNSGTNDESVARSLLADRIGEQLVRRLPQAIDDHPRLGRGSSWNGVAWYGYLNKDLRTLLGRHVDAPYSAPYCGEGHRVVCRNTLRESLLLAIKRVKRVQDVASVDALTYDKSLDFIRSVTAGTVGVRPIDWQNRPTFQQVVSFVRHRPR